MKKKHNSKGKLWILAIAALAAMTGAGISIKINSEGGVEQPDVYVEAKIEYSEEQLPAVVEDDLGEIIEVNEVGGEEIKTVEEVDGGPFKDDLDPKAGDKGEVETFDVSSPEAFKNATLGRCIIAGNYYGAQCVSLARSYWFSYAGRDVSTCGTGMAKGMMNCADQNAGDDFSIYWAEDKRLIQAGDWLVFDGGLYGHVGMALGPVVNGYVALLGENQGGASCGANVGGSATNIININIKNLIGFYRPKAYIKPEPAPEPTPEPAPTPAPVDNCQKHEVAQGDTLGQIMLDCRGKVEWGEAMNEYARHWYSTKYQAYLTVFDGWASQGGYGLFSGDVIEYRSGE